MRVLALLTDAYGGRGGIAKFNRDLCEALCTHPRVDGVTAIPRIVPDPPGPLPEGLDFQASEAGSAGRFIRATLREARPGRYRAVVCGHLRLLPLAAVAAWRARARLVLVVHGIEAWGPPHWQWASPRIERLTRLAARRLDAFVAVSDLTRQRFARWMRVPAERGTVVPNCIDTAPFGPGPKPPALLARYGLDGRTVLLTLSRLSAGERYKGLDEVMEALPRLAESVPDVAYLICGDGDDRARLEAKAQALGVADRVVFAGYVPEAEKPDHYRLADAFVMPGRGEGFGIVYLEALACGIPVVASSADASQEAVRHGELGRVVDPDDQDALVTAMRDAVRSPKEVPEGLAYFSTALFAERWHRVVDATFTP
jgi:glycosyltransferase involved in cell wall biosynthesis